MSEIELFQFQGSHFNEKARWTLDLKHVPHERTSLLPGAHLHTVKRLSGQTSTPVLRLGEETVAGSAQIIERLERDFPEPALYPDDLEERARAVEIVREFDAEVGPAVRLVKFYESLDAVSLVEDFGSDRSPLVKRLYGASFPILGRVMWRMLKISEQAAERDRARIRQAFDFVATQAGDAGYLVGRRFSVADLTCAALLMPAVCVSEWGGPRVSSTARTTAWLACWADHPGAEWVREIYRRHRRA
jgi:glutathione S-transferase